MLPRLNLVTASFDDEAFERAGFSLWRFVYPDGWLRQTFTSVPGVRQAYAAGQLLACASRPGTREVYMLAASPEHLAAAGPKRLRRAAGIPVAVLLKLALHSGRVRWWGERPRLVGLFGTWPLWSTTGNRHLKVAIEWAVTEEAPGLYSLFPHCRGFRTHPRPWPDAATRDAGGLDLPVDEQAPALLFRPVRTGTGARAWYYVEVPGAVLGAWREGWLVHGASVQNSHESDLDWATADEGAAAATRATAVASVLAALPRSAVGRCLHVRPQLRQHTDRRTTPSFARVRREAWTAVREQALPGRRLCLVDLRLDRHHDIASVHQHVASTAGWAGLPPPTLRALPPGATDEAAVAQAVGAWHREDPPDTGWICVVDEPDRLPRGRLDTKGVAYRTAAGRPLQSVCSPSVLGGRLRRVGKDNADPPVPTAFKAVLLDLLVDAEVQAGRLLWRRPWLVPATRYLFVEAFPHGDTFDVVGLRVDQSGGLAFRQGEPDRLAAWANEMAVRPLVHDQAAALMFPGGVHIQETNIRVMPPTQDSRRGWMDLMGVCVYPELCGYTASGLDNPNGRIAKGIGLRIVRNGDGVDLDAIAGMCLDPTVRVNQSTVLPPPFKMLREWHEAQAPLSAPSNTAGRP